MISVKIKITIRCSEFKALKTNCFSLIREPSTYN